MARGIPRSGGTSDVAPLTVKRLKGVPLERLTAFRMEREREDRKTGEKYDVVQVVLGFAFNSGHVQRSADGEPVLDDQGNTQAHMIHDGFVTLSGHAKANLPTILRALGFDDDRFMDREEGGLTSDAAESIEVEFGKNGLGHDYRGKDWDDLPFYVVGGKERKGEVEVPITSFKMLGYELVGRRCDMVLTIDKNGYNRIDSYIPMEDPDPLTDTPPKPKAKGLPGEQRDPEPFLDDKGIAEQQANRALAPMLQPNEGEPEPETKRAAWTTKRLQEANIPASARIQVLRALTGDDSIDSIHGITVEQAKAVKEMFDADPANLVQAYEHVMDSTEPPVADDDDDFEDDI